MKKLISLLIVFILYLNISLATTTAIGKVRINILNSPPIIQKMQIIPEELYPDSIAECTADVMDELPLEVKYYYRWYKNDVLLKENSKNLQNFNENDKITCKIIPEDLHGVKGLVKNISANIKEIPVQVKIMKPVLNSVGIETTTAELLKQTSMKSITGNVIGTTDAASSSLILLIIIFFLIIINLNLAVRIFAKKRLRT
jgi:hypothetical protein